MKFTNHTENSFDVEFDTMPTLPIPNNGRYEMLATKILIIALQEKSISKPGAYRVYINKYEMKLDYSVRSLDA
ncbi:MAG TPA: hypothetical protein VN843_02005 [Anaerolineales bacterium]|nr:hypothetical protein [Anaerolineales bacterium]